MYPSLTVEYLGAQTDLVDRSVAGRVINIAASASEANRAEKNTPVSLIKRISDREERTPGGSKYKHKKGRQECIFAI